MYRVKSVGIMALAKMMAALYGLMGLIYVPFILIAAAFGMFSGQGSAGVGIGVGLIVVAVLVPLLCAFFGFIGGLIAGLLYNLVAGRVGGIELELVPPPMAGGVARA